MATTSIAFERAVGLSFFWAHMHTGHTVRFVGTSWEDGGFLIDDDGRPVSDSRGNTVARAKVENLDPSNAEHVAQVEEWYG